MLVRMGNSGMMKAGCGSGPGSDPVFVRTVPSVQILSFKNPESKGWVHCRRGFRQIVCSLLIVLFQICVNSHLLKCCGAALGADARNIKR